MGAVSPDPREAAGALEPLAPAFAPALCLAHFSDVHVTEAPGRIPWRRLLSKRFLGWMNLRFSRRGASFSAALEVIEAFQRDLREERPEHILSTGDLTGLALPSEFEAARRAFGPLLEARNVSGLPGNHDVYVEEAVRERYYQRAFGEWSGSDLRAVSLDALPPALRALHPFPTLRLLGDHAALVCLSDARPNALHDSTCRLGRMQLLLLDEILGAEEVRDRVKIVACHAGFRRHDGSRDRWFHALRDADGLLAVAEDHGVALIVHGHTHHRFAFEAGRFATAALANPGSLSSARHARAYHVYVIERDRVRLEVRRFVSERGRFESWPEAPGTGVLWRRP